MKREILVPIIMLCVVALIPMLTWGQSNDTTTAPKLFKILIPVRELNEFVTIQHNHYTGENNYSGFAIEVFEEVMKYAFPTSLYKFEPFQKRDGTMNGTFDDMLMAVASKDNDYDGAVSEISILFSRINWVDFTMPYLESSITMLVPIKQQPTSKAAGFSLTGITYAFVITTFVISFIAFLVAAVYVGISIRARCSRKDDNRQSRDKTLGSLIQTRLMMITFFLLLLTLNACYIVSQASSSSTSQPRSGTVRNLIQLIRKGSNVGYRDQSFIKDLLLSKGVPEANLRSLKTESEMVDMLSKGTVNGGVDAIVANAPHLKLLQAKYCDNFTLVPTTNLRATGFGFAFKRGSGFAKELSDSILKIVDNGKLGKIQDRTIGSLETCQENDPNGNNIEVGSSFLSNDHKWILIVGGLLAALLIIVSFIFLF